MLLRPASTEATDELLTSVLITALEGRNVESQKWQAVRDTAFDGLQVLTDTSTAGRRELFAAAIHNRGSWSA